MKKIFSLLIAAILGISSAFATTIYCKMDKSWWTINEFQQPAAVGIYTWNDGGDAKAAWPGERMTPVEGQEGVWSFDLDLTTYHMCIFTRVNAEGDIADWGAKSGDLIIPTDGKNLFTITSDEPVWGDPGVVGVWSVYGVEPAPAPETAPEVPTQDEANVMAIYCNHYATNNANFNLSGWPGAYQTLNLDGTTVALMSDMTWECIIDPAHTDDAHDFSAYENVHVDMWAPAAAQIKFVAEAVAGGNYKDGQVLDLVAGWNSFDIALADWAGNYDFANMKCFVLEQYKTPEGESFEHNPFAIANIYFWNDAEARELAKVGFNLPAENRPADDKIEMVGTFQEGTMWMEKIIATGWFVSYEFVNAKEDDTFKLRSKENNDLILCEYIPANGGAEGKWVQAIFTFGDYWSEDTWHGTPCMLIELDIAENANYAWKEGMPEPDPSEGIINTTVGEKAVKIMHNGMLLIIKGDKTYNVMGQIVK